MPSSHSNLFMIDLEGTELSDIEREIVHHPNVGSIILFTRNFTNPRQLEDLIHEIHAINPHIFFTTDHEGGFIQRFVRHGFRSIPAPRVYGDVYDLNPEVGIQLAKQYGEIMAKDLITCGIDLSLAPVLDLHAQSPIIAHLDRAFHHNPDVITALAGAFIEGMNAAGMPAVAKHFPGHGSVSVDSHKAMPVSITPLEELKNKDLKPFIDLHKKGLLSAIMPAHVTYKAVDANKPAGFSTIWLQDILRHELKFEGLIISDCLSMTGADIGDLMTRTQEALKAGCDMLIVCHQPRHVLLELIQKTSLPYALESAARITQFKNQMLRFSHPEKNQPNPHLLLETTENDPRIESKNQQFNTSETI
ncbi:beta-N-acetylhexosaminidase [Fluoribacter dumoffii]|uniref:beta-N-acetylhexosaminidase n=1 Tax=Fluoribacter dumoffii TaxID=463 RepID=A0A377G5Y2_9GAMM|nr:beta-N-acetylhexosaminidase [Fluoribacter dumoffii]KTC92546.1 beta N-acetyl-glucosaminidase [Fluoribacter dumoffii NY 23]MCW8387122.1 beta-N-acetylhexosaminidase [Fluoribacter dumoffii]MCW8417374.1 beta-N-acetylhexosaminidase [Fluoribacter dumoffii]MCW8454785.1 beta-N-acetylhexosaminidase [Fluoribacter dumoffii]MCW8461138.1 beta-N-acetylhexosaminidase [Fluoribacter dumoffii]